MNQRIKELKQQATDYVDSVDAGLKLDHYQQFVDLKFAELMVSKFDDILLLQYLDCIGNHDKKSAELIEQIREKIKTYFGVE